ncbi:hypothetical protein [Methanoculleus sp.]|uniref:hypothetical protein n=1 Tax=Methanoculleus sp. TaxID=90427 RepID=UPI002FC63833
MVKSHRQIASTMGFPWLVRCSDTHVRGRSEQNSPSLRVPSCLSAVAGIVAREILLSFCSLAVLALLTSRLPCQSILAFASMPIPL